MPRATNRGGFAQHPLPDPRRPHIEHPAVSLVHPENQVNLFLSHSGARPLACAPVPQTTDTLLVFNSLALYVDRHGHRARDTELMYTAHPQHHAVNETHLLIFTATHIDIYDIESGEWVQTINIHRRSNVLLSSVVEWFVRWVSWCRRLERSRVRVPVGADVCVMNTSIYTLVMDD
ncbi:hypothetical protein evm_012522 [Chilo suppressalis]|nr:hypothetical protein evm_012522 [Chilo suppressalis]